MKWRFDFSISTVLLILALPCKNLRVFTPTLPRRKLNKMKYFTFLDQRIEVTANLLPQNLERQTNAKNHKIRSALPGAKAARATGKNI